MIKEGLAMKKTNALKILGTIILTLILIYSLVRNQGNFHMIFVAVTYYIILLFSMWNEKK